ncbi:ferric-chelate reductase Frp1 [Emydomyces testavorans]|uniref:ferric-chelate reductase (NADPH) n=1 Tax=Emydomyces testavorans TaxID=2070801 RepID=A0AAF0IPJ2_9EURO|nr:ferric-chelate reductase Frp1 [Emydomyces testavorans]
MERRHDHGGGASTDAGSGVPSMFHMQRMYWAVVGTVLAVATVANIMNRVIAAQRFADSTLTPSKPKACLFKAYATATAMARECWHATASPVKIGNVRIDLPPLGPASIILTNVVVVVVLCFYKLDTMDQWSWETIGYRTGFIAVAQLPLIILLAGKNNIIGFLTGSSYERLNWLHRWTSRTLWLTATIHMGFWFRSWGRYDYIVVKLKTDALTQRGFAAWCILSFIVVSSTGPVRRLSYEVFVLLHIATFSGFIAVTWLHVLNEVKAWVWLPIALLVFDRVTRYAFMIFANLRLPFLRRKSEARQGSKWTNRAIFTPLPGNVTKITIREPVISWKAGQHVLLSCHSILPLQSHPFTIASIPSDRKLEFLVRAERGGTRKLFHYASTQNNSLGQAGGQFGFENAKIVTIDGPYGRIRPLRQFDSVVLIAGNMGATFTMPLLRDIVEGWKNEYLDRKPGRSEARPSSNFALTKRIRFVWIVRAQSHLTWFVDQLQQLMQDINDCADSSKSFNETRHLEISIYLTCDIELRSAPMALLAPADAQRPPSTRSSSIRKESTTLLGKERQSAVETSFPPEGRPTSNEATGGALQGVCYCTNEVVDETAPSAPCTCSGQAATCLDTIALTSETNAARSEKPLPPSTSAPGSLLHSRITILSGRPHVRSIILPVLEQAEGESGVVVCGPKGLNADVRRSVVSLSDERAVHKGTGAQGIYLHVEEFGF